MNTVFPLDCFQIPVYQEEIYHEAKEAKASGPPTCIGSVQSHGHDFVCHPQQIIIYLLWNGGALPGSSRDGTFDHGTPGGHISEVLTMVS